MASVPCFRKLCAFQGFLGLTAKMQRVLAIRICPKTLQDVGTVWYWKIMVSCCVITKRKIKQKAEFNKQT